MKKKTHQLWPVLLLLLCMGMILAGGLEYIASLRNSLKEQTIGNVLTVTQQQQQAFDNFISGEQERLHSFAVYFSRNSSRDTDEIHKQLEAFGEMDAYYTVINLFDGTFCCNKTDDLRKLRGKELDGYRSLYGRGVRDSYTGLYTHVAMFGYYESFVFSDGVRGLIQKSTDRSKVSETFSLSFYNDQGLAYVVNQKGEILLHSNGMLAGRVHDNILDILTGSDKMNQQEIDNFMEDLRGGKTGSKVFTGDEGSYVYAYVPVENVKEWSLVSIVPMEAITAEADRILLDSQMAVSFLLIILMGIGVFLMVTLHTYQNMVQKDRAIEYQERIFEIFSTHLSNNTNDVYTMMDLERVQTEYISPNCERVLGVPAEKISADIRSFAGAGGSGGEKLDADKVCSMKPGDVLEPVTTMWVNPATKETQWLQVNIYCVEVQGESRLILYISDRTRERKNQEYLTEALNLARAASDAKSAFLSSVSHDIRTPMNAIIGFLALMRQDVNKPDAVLEYTQRIDAASQHLLGLINDVLDMNKIESGSATLNLSEMCMADIIDEINTIIRPQAKAKNQNFEIYVSFLTCEYFQGDKLRINQILINLLSNSVKYTQAGGEIHMRVEELSQVVDKCSRIRFTIRDNGMGMSEDYLKVIFDPFTREETAATRQIQGTGLGMAITKSLVDLMGGTIQVESELGKGSTFTVELELYIDEREDDPRFWQDHKVAKMIVADDEEEVCLNIVKAMKQTGVAADYSTDGQTAVQMMRSAREKGEPYDLILLDWKMPGLDGLETARLIRKNYPDKIPILLLTAYDWGEIEQEAKEIGVNHFMPKPFFMSTFREAIRRVMGNRKKREMVQDHVVKGKHILVVDDIEVNRIILVKILNTLGARCDTAGNGQEALEIFEASQPGDYDIILMDVQMPVMDGYSATRAIRASKHPSAKTMPIIAMTANAFVDDVRDAIESGMDAHVAKPVQVDTLKAAIQQVLDRRANENIGIKEGSLLQ